MAHIEKRGKNYLIRVSVGYDSKGRKITKSTTFKPEYSTATGRAKAESVIEKEVQSFAAEFEKSVKSGEHLQGGNIKFDALVERYLEECAFVKLSQATAEGYKSHLEKKIIPAFGHVKISDLCRQQLEIQKFYNKMTKPRADGTTMAASTIRRSIAVFSTVMQWAVDMQLIPSNPLTHVKTPRKEYQEEKVKSFNIDELNRFIAALDMPLVANYREHTCKKRNGNIYYVSAYTEERRISEQFKLFYIMAAFSGCRRGELIALDWPDVDFSAGTIRISKSASKTSDGIIIKETKTSSGIRTINMPDSVMEAARKWKIHQKEMRLVLGSAWMGENNVFCQLNGSRMYPDTVTAKFKDILRNYNAQCAPADRLPDISLHGLRHTSASVLINQHTDIATVSKRLGHSRTSVTLDIYTHAIQEADKAAAELLDSIAKSAGI